MKKRLFVCCIMFLLSACGAPPGPSPTPPAMTSVTASPAATSISITPRPSLPEDVAFYQARMRLVDLIQAQGVTDPDVLRVMRAVPRHAFVRPEFLDQAYNDHALPIGYGQTISQPFIVAWMTELLELEPGDRVLEIGSGSGYQAAVLAELGYVEVYTIEIVPELATSATARLRELGYSGIHSMQGDGYYGWLEYAPFDAIIVTAAPDHLPAPLAEQLAEGGRLVIPIGPPGWYQTLWKFVKEKGELKAYSMGGVVFVPFTGAGAEKGPASGEPIP